MVRSKQLLSGDPTIARRFVGLAAAAAVIVLSALSVFIHPLVGVAAAMALLIAPFVLRDIDVAFLAVVAVITLLPFAALPLGIGFNPTLLDFALGALYMIWIFRIVTREPGAIRWPPLSVGVIALIGIMLLAFLAGTAHGMPTKNQIRVFGELVLGAGLFIVVGSLVSDRRSLRRVFLALVGFGAVSAAIGLVLYAMPHLWQAQLLSFLRVFDYPSGLGVLRFLNDDPSRLQRATGTSIDPNSFGGMLAVVAALLAPQVISRSPLVSRRVAWFMLALLVGALFATVSRGSIAAFVVGVGVIGLARDRRLLVAAFAGGLGLLVLAQLLPWTAAYVEHFTQGLRVQDRATLMRVGEYRDAIRLIERYPTLGVGFGSPRDIDLYRGVSSLYLIIAETMGLLGLTAFVGLMAAVLVRLTRAWRSMAPDGMRAVVLGCLAAVVVALFGGVFDHYFFTYPHAFALLWLIVGLGMGAVGLARDASSDPRQ